MENFSFNLHFMIHLAVFFTIFFVAVSSQSVSSETSSDYAVPPDEVSINTSDSSDNSEPEQKLLKYTAEHFHKVLFVI